MRTTLTSFAAALIFAAAAIPLGSTPADARKGRNTALGVGVVLGIAAAAALANSANAEPRRRRSGNVERGRSYCGKLLRRCQNGSNYSCEKYETGGCTE